jgi:hypothetical protein
LAIQQRTKDLLEHLAQKPGHDEVKSDFRQLLMEEFGAELGNLDFERRVPEVKGRIDALIGRTVFEAKSDIDREWQDIVRRMPDYLADREREEGEPFVGIASDGRKWVIFERRAGQLEKIKETTLDPDKGDEFLAWLDGVVALKVSLHPEPLTIRTELGQESVAFRRAAEGLRELWLDLQADPAIALKRQLWASLLKLVYGKDVESEALWLQHTYLVIVAKAIATAVLDVREDDPARMLSGSTIQSANIFGAVESDFFDWPVTGEKGKELVRRIMAHVRRFRLREVQSDVLKVLYESLIDRAERHGLGEYYTPDWLAAKVVRKAIERPTQQQVLDPACGSGTFLFHAIRNFLAEAEDVGMDAHLRAGEVTNHVVGMDIHPVAVIIARVTYLLALAPALAKREGALSIPVYLGDAMQLSISQMLGGRELKITVPPPAAGDRMTSPHRGAETLDFPETFCRDPRLFDKVIEAMRSGSQQDWRRKQVEAALVRITEQHLKRDVTAEEKTAITDLGQTYEVFDRLRREGRDTVWAYVARNLSRPLSLSASGGWAHVIVGNPPWVAYRYMSEDLQKRFKSLAKAERVYVGGKFATQNDLSALFFVRATALYLRSGGKIAMVLPLAALTRGQFDKLRTGAFDSTRIRYTEAWTMDDSVQPLFPVPSCVVFGRKQATSGALPDTVQAYRGQLPYRDAPEAVADKLLDVTADAPAPSEGSFEGGSPYRNRFRNGATLYPRMLVFVERVRSSSVLGADTSAPHVTSRRTSQEKAPWKETPNMTGAIESQFLQPTLMGESILPFRILRPLEGVIPVDKDGSILDAQGAAGRGYLGLHAWMRRAETLWAQNNDADRMSLVERWNYHNELGAQFPISRLRVVYSKAGTVPAASIVQDIPAVIENSLYWLAPASETEAYYLVAILNSEAVRKRIESKQAKGQWGARHFDKVMFTLPIPLFDDKVPLHGRLADAGREAESLAASVEIFPQAKFQGARSKVRKTLTEVGISQRIDALVEKLLGAV